MSDGPIKHERDAWKPPTVSTSAKDRVCHLSDGRTACGRRNKATTTDWAHVHCQDCTAAHRADMEAAR